MTVPTAPVAELRSPSRAEEPGWDPCIRDQSSPGRRRLEPAGPPCSLPPLPGGLHCRSHQFAEVEGAGPGAAPVLALDGSTVRDKMWNQKNMKKELRDWVHPCPAWRPQGDYNLHIFLLLFPRGALAPLFLNYTRMYHAGKPETCWGCQAPHIIVCPLGLCLCCLVLSFFIW